MSKISVGDIAPNISLYDMDRKLRSLAEFKAKNIVIAFYPGAFTSVCKKEMCTLRDSIAGLEKLNAQIIGVSVNDPFSNKAFHEMNMLNFPLLCDYNRKAIELYGVAMPDFAGLKGYTAAKRSAFIVDKEGVVRYRWITDDPSKEPKYAEIEEFLKTL